MPLTDPDEVFYAETAREMLARGEYLTPYIFGKPQFEKPPLFYWLVETSFKIFGENEFAARLPAAVFGILGVVGVYLLGKFLFSARCGLFSALALATSLENIILSRACVTDIVLSAFILYAFLFFLYGYHKEKYKRINYSLSSIFLALAVLTKGPIGVILPLLIIFIYMIWAGEIKKIKEMPVLLGAFLFLAVALPWYILVHKIHGAALMEEFFGFHNVIRFLEPEHVEGSQIYYNVPVFLGGFFPWSPFFPFALWIIFAKKENTQIKKHNKLLLIWFLVIFIFFSVSRTKLPTYIFPLFPAAAIFVGRFWDIFLEATNHAGIKRLMTFSFWILAISGLATAAVLYTTCNVKYPSAMGSGLIAGMVYLSGIAVSFILYFRKKYFLSFFIVCAASLLGVIPLAIFTMPEASFYVSSKEISGELLKFVAAGDKIGAETQYTRGIAYYTKREDIIDVHKHHIITKLLDEPGRIWCVIKEKNHIQLYTDEKAPFKNPTYVVYKFGKRVIMTNKIPPDGKFLKKRTFSEPY